MFDSVSGGKMATVGERRCVTGPEFLDRTSNISGRINGKASGEKVKSGMASVGPSAVVVAEKNGVA
jgi:hypothetical protein